MKNCSVCDNKMTWLNTPGLTLGKLKTEGRICTKCWGKVTKIGLPKGVISTRSASLSEVQEILNSEIPVEASSASDEKSGSICSYCQKPPTTAGKKLGSNLIDGWICGDCIYTIAKNDPSLGVKFHNYTLAQLQSKVEGQIAKGTKLEEIKAQIQELKLDNIATFFGRKEINELPNILAPSETVDNIIQGFYSGGNGILVSTERRLIFIDKGMIYGLKVEDFPLDKISSIQYETGLLMAKVKIHTSGNVATIDNVEKNAARSFAEFVRDKLSRPKPTEPVQVAPRTDVLDQLEKLGKLKTAGVLSDIEFEEQKKKLLDKL